MTRERQHDKRGGGTQSEVVRWRCTIIGGGCTKQGGEAAVHRFITQQPTLFLAEWGVMRGNKRGDEREERQQERREATREERGDERGERQSVTREGWRDVKGVARQERGSMTREAAVHRARGGAPFSYATTNLVWMHSWQSGG